MENRGDHVARAEDQEITDSIIRWEPPGQLRHMIFKVMRLIQPIPYNIPVLGTEDGAMNTPIQVLDHGYVRFVEAWGHGDAGEPERHTEGWTEVDMECGIIEAARQSTQASFRGWEDKACPSCISGKHSQAKNCNSCEGKGYLPGDARLLKYLYTHDPKHATPFEFAGMVIEVQAPIFVFREWHRHRTQSYNEMSARYSPLPDLNYVPTVERLMINAGTTNKQAGTVKGAVTLNVEAAEVFQRELRILYDHAEVLYQHALATGIPKELARCGLPVGRYSRMRAQANLRNWLAFMTLRMDPAAQWEIREYANVVASIIEQQFPRVYGLFAAERFRRLTPGAGTTTHGPAQGQT